MEARGKLTGPDPPASCDSLGKSAFYASIIYVEQDGWLIDFKSGGVLIDQSVGVLPSLAEPLGVQPSQVKPTNKRRGACRHRYPEATLPASRPASCVCKSF